MDSPRRSGSRAPRIGHQDFPRAYMLRHSLSWDCWDCEGLVILGVACTVGVRMQWDQKDKSDSE